MLRAAMKTLLRVCVVGAVLVLAACDQDEGEPCQTDRDCASGLECNRAPGAERGDCVPPDEVTTGGTGGTGGEDGLGGFGGDTGGTGGTGDDDAGTSDADGG